jgi:hypothetical protein
MKNIEKSHNLSAYQLRCLKQNEDWLNGRSFHNFIDDECCPDFSCCNPELFTDDRSKRLKRVNNLREAYGLNKRQRHDA